jgi:hypothetical protein
VKRSEVRRCIQRRHGGMQELRQERERRRVKKRDRHLAQRATTRGTVYKRSERHYLCSAVAPTIGRLSH